MPDVRAFRAVRYACLAPSLVAPPYDVIGPQERLRLLAADPHNVAHLTLHESEEEAGALFRRWLEEGVLVREDEPATWAVTQEYVGPDGVARLRGGLVASLRAEPYETGAVLPHERTHAGPKESRLRLLRAAGAQLEPIFLLYDGEQPVTGPERDPDLAVGGTRLWRLDEDALGSFFADRQLLIADGHHRYETALAYHGERRTPASARVLAVLVSTSDPGLEIFPTHRVFTGRDDIEVAGEPLRDVEEGMARLDAASHRHAVAVAYRRGRVTLAAGAEGELDVELVDRFGLEGIDYTPDWHEAVARVDQGEADIAFLLRPTRIEDVFACARRGEVLPPKTTYFYPKLVSGLLFHPLEDEP
jgi:uncharacterized protein (DUF1015 family)